MPRIERDRELSRRRNRKVKLKKLREKYNSVKSDSEKEAILEKARRISPFVEFEEQA